MISIRLAMAALLAALPGSTSPTSVDRAWDLANPVLIIDPYAPNRLDFDQLVTDRSVKAMIHQAYRGLREDTAYSARVDEARRRGLLVGLYLLGVSGDWKAQAEKLIAAGRAKKVALLALDIENREASSMTLDDAERFIVYVHEQTGRYPLLYTNFSTYQFIVGHYPETSAFAKAPLWVARFRTQLGMTDRRLWQDYSIWQFQSEINCARCPASLGTQRKVCYRQDDGVHAQILDQPCFHGVPGTDPDMDVNVFRGSTAELTSLFGG